MTIKPSQLKIGDVITVTTVFKHRDTGPTKTFRTSRIQSMSGTTDSVSVTLENGFSVMFQKGGWTVGADTTKVKSVIKV